MESGLDLGLGIDNCFRRNLMSILAILSEMNLVLKGSDGSVE